MSRLDARSWELLLGLEESAGSLYVQTTFDRPAGESHAA